MNDSIEIKELPMLYRYDTSGSDRPNVALFLHKYQTLAETPQAGGLKFGTLKDVNASGFQKLHIGAMRMKRRTGA